MVSNLGFDNGHPYIEEGADEGVFINGPRISTSDQPLPSTVSVEIERSIDGETWEPVIDLTDETATVDWESLSYGDTVYRATGYTADGATAETIITVEARSIAVWLSTGNGFSLAGRLPFDPDVQVTVSRDRTLKQYAGRSLPVALTGEGVSRTVQASGRTALHPVGEQQTADVDRLTDIAQSESDVFLYRDPDGRRVYGAIGDMQLPRQAALPGRNALWGYSFTLTETGR